MASKITVVKCACICCTAIHILLHWIQNSNVLNMEPVLCLQDSWFLFWKNTDTLKIYCLFLCSLRYHLLHPDYLYFRIRELQKNFKLRVVLCHVDVVSSWDYQLYKLWLNLCLGSLIFPCWNQEDVIKPLLEVTKTALLHDCTLLCGWRYASVWLVVVILCTIM